MSRVSRPRGFSAVAVAVLEDRRTAFYWTNTTTEADALEWFRYILDEHPGCEVVGGIYTGRLAPTAKELERRLTTPPHELRLAADLGFRALLVDDASARANGWEPIGGGS